MNKLIYSWIALCLMFLFVHCGPAFKLNQSRSALNTMIKGSPVFNRHFTGFVLYDPVTRETLCDFLGSKYFTPASNTKLLTLYTALNVLPDSMPAFRYARSGDDLVIKGMGDPTLLHPLWADHAGFEIIRSAKKITWIQDQLMDDSWGSGWAWDDYVEAYQAEKSDLPLFGNVVRFKATAPKGSYEVYPGYFQNKWTHKTIKKGDPKFSRLFTDNEFGLASPDSAGIWHLPYRTDHHTIKKLLEDTLGYSIQSRWMGAADQSLSWNIAYGVPVDSVYAEMMKSSDNFIAEQLMLVCSAYLFDTLNTTRMIDYAKGHFFATVPDTLHWVDGSGLSRYNLFTPRSVVDILEKIKNKLSWERIERIFPAGGVSGTLKKWYPGLSQPYIFAKTGSLSNNHSLSGYLKTRNGRTLIFSFMHSNYIGSVNPIRLEMQKTLEHIRDNF
ncbi:MAG: D-alanyl-D-alanine carboxypeptidase [Saprospiraceae bacterium]|nr:D-alanyl-D-alanine carboxypeptidase [Saprospiraceae bacterium]